ncbi:MAG TPA: heterodisulfide reductase-related iron-sulfur binding cluster, partial [Thermoanaerobaculia bacterium]|nr:heterodisulfide reductase-related iron-sulfur binding cluster [Thermoanaerobaculia bacterium]
GCRRCFSLCPSFDALFRGLDVDEVDGDSEKLPASVLDDFVDLCYECRLCIPHCPYVPPHRWGVHIPHLVLEARRVRVKERGVPLRDRVLSGPDRIGRLSRPVAPLVNFLSTLPVARAAMERTLGIARKKSLPRYESETFTRWFAARKKPPHTREVAARVVLFPTCSVEWNRPSIGKAAVQVLERNGVDVEVAYPGCCGMPSFDVGDVDAVEAARARTVAALKPFVEDGRTVVVPGPSCSLMLKKEYGWASPDASTAFVAAATRDLGEFLVELKAKGALDTAFPSAPRAVAYHLPCHLKVQNIGYRSRDLLALTGARVSMVERCSGHDGTWAMRAEYFEESMKVGSKLFAALTEANADVLASDCPLAALQIEQGTGKKVLHPIEVLRDAYGLPRDA